jgi:hypothetical protein
VTRAALILFDDDDPAVAILGVSWPEYRVRQAVRAGAMHIVVIAGRITPRIIAAIDWAKSAGVSAVLARTSGEIADLIHPDETVLLMSGPAMVGDRLMTDLMNASQPTLVCLGADADPAWELIDARDRWTGLARLDGAQVRTTAAMVGDWDLGSTLLRGAVATASRQMLSPGDDLWRGDDGDDVAHAQHAIVTMAAPAESGLASRFIIAPLARLSANAVGHRLAVVADFCPWIAAVPLAAGIGFAWFKWPVAAAFLLLLAFASDALGLVAERATGLRPKFYEWRGRVLDAGAVIILAGLVIPPAIDRAPLVLAVVLIVMTILVRRLYRGNDDPRWLADVPGYAATIGLAALFGTGGMVIGLALSAVHALASLAWLQNRLSGVLTQAR